MTVTPQNDEERAVLEFLAIWGSPDLEGIIEGSTPDASYIDVTLPPWHGITAIRACLQDIFSVFTVQIETLPIASCDGVVFAERIE